MLSEAPAVRDWTRLSAQARTILQPLLAECDAGVMRCESSATWQVAFTSLCYSGRVHEGAVAQRDAGQNRGPNSSLGIRSRRNCAFSPSISVHCSHEPAERTFAMEQIMQSLERINAWIVSTMSWRGAISWRGAMTSSVVLACAMVVMHAQGAESIHASRNADGIDDVRRQAQIVTAYAVNPLLRNSVLIVTVSGSNASLVGKVGSAIEKQLAEEIASSVEGIAHVDNLLGVTDMPPANPAAGLSFGEKVDDATTTAAIRSKLLWGATTSGLDIHVVTVRGKVRLDGTVYDGEQRDLIGHVAADTAGVLAVANEIVIFSVPPVTSGAQADARSADSEMHRPVSDAWITARVRSTFLLSPSMNRSAITVATSEGSVSLSGIAASASARTSAIALTQNTRGVQRVDSTRLAAN